MKNLTKTEQKNLLDFLQVYDFHNAFRVIRELLAKVHKEDYAPIVYGLVKIDIVNKNKEYSLAINYLDSLLNKKFKFDIGFIKRLMSQADHNQDEREQTFIKEILENAKSLDLDAETKCELYDYIEELLRKEEDKNEKDPSRKSAKRLVEREHQKLLDGECMILLDSRFNDKKDEIIDVCESYADIRTFVVRDHKDRERIVLRYKDPLYTMVNFPEKLKEGKDAIKKQDYKKGRDVFAFLLCHGKPKFNVYKSLGLCYAGLGEYKKALDYFTVAEGLAKEEGLKSGVAEVRNFVLEQYLQSEKSSTQILEMINEACKEEGTNYNDLLNGLAHAKIEINVGTLLQIALYEPDTFRKIIEIAEEARTCKEQNIPYDKYSSRTKSGHMSFKTFAGEIRANNPQQTIEERKANFKPFVSVRSKEFDYDSDFSLYGIHNFDEFDFYLQETGEDLETVAERFEFTPHQINLIRLIYAREYYLQGYFEKGDEFIKSVEQDKNKDEFVLGVLSKIREKKSFYRHRRTDNPRVLSLTLKPKKKHLTE